MPYVLQRADRTDREVVAVLCLQLHELGVGQVVNMGHVRLPAPIYCGAQLRRLAQIEPELLRWCGLCHYSVADSQPVLPCLGVRGTDRSASRLGYFVPGSGGAEPSASRQVSLNSGT